MPTTTDLLAAALDYAARGWPVFPLAPGTKKPAIAHDDGGRGFHDATTDAGQIAAWWKRWPRANIGMPTGRVSGIVVVDVDPRNGGDASHLLLPATLIVRTPSGGMHYYFTVSKGQAIPKDNTGRLGQGIDFLGDGAYVVLPPSVLREGVGYDWRLCSYYPHRADRRPARERGWTAHRAEATTAATSQRRAERARHTAARQRFALAKPRL